MLLLSKLHAKIHNATVTEANLSYVGSITIDPALLNAVGLEDGERVLVVSNTSGARLETYVIVDDQDQWGQGRICMNGAAAHLIKTGEQVIIMAFALTDQPIDPQVILVDEVNHFVRYLAERPSTPAEEC